MNGRFAAFDAITTAIKNASAFALDDIVFAAKTGKPLVYPDVKAEVEKVKQYAETQHKKIVTDLKAECEEYIQAQNRWFKEQFEKADEQTKQNQKEAVEAVHKYYKDLIAEHEAGFKQFEAEMKVAYDKKKAVVEERTRLAEQLAKDVVEKDAQIAVLAAESQKIKSDVEKAMQEATKKVLQVENKMAAMGKRFQGANAAALQRERQIQEERFNAFRDVKIQEAEELLKSKLNIESRYDELQRQRRRELQELDAKWRADQAGYEEKAKQLIARVQDAAKQAGVQLEAKVEEKEAEIADLKRQVVVAQRECEAAIHYLRQSEAARAQPAVPPSRFAGPAFPPPRPPPQEPAPPPPMAVDEPPQARAGQANPPMAGEVRLMQAPGGIGMNRARPQRVVYFKVAIRKNKTFWIQADELRSKNIDVDDLQANIATRKLNCGSYGCVYLVDNGTKVLKLGQIPVEETKWSALAGQPDINIGPPVYQTFPITLYTEAAGGFNRLQKPSFAIEMERMQGSLSFLYPKGAEPAVPFVHDMAVSFRELVLRCVGEKEIAHGDLHADNVLFKKNGDKYIFYLTDWGATMAPHDRSRTNPEIWTMLRAFQFLCQGTWIAPGTIGSDSTKNILITLYKKATARAKPIVVTLHSDLLSMYTNAYNRLHQRYQKPFFVLDFDGIKSNIYFPKPEYLDLLNPKGFAPGQPFYPGKPRDV